MSVTTAERGRTEVKQGAASLLIQLQEVPLVATVPQACRLLSTSRKRIYELLANGELKSYARGRKRLITGASIVRHLEANVQADYVPIMDSPYQPRTSRRAKRSAKK